ncbi:LEA type 2 family protein [Geoalkalibacter halelectricus]|uniref:LEA type 2 family protein n=1 Tax=Geoalkalibacter halelectricus TaxID=2847045 RepID=A0ABY5ZPY8_9BACT|nr:LEA type 2 family protein [Geoalkalibacter halelectricus]MDO3379909.1 LEA type 2 family protein [Geoalkalibacter halelectricus]UWZ80564.1 LEA type 2 family protein [Geoalkalibacter halelectricus]
MKSILRFVLPCLLVFLVSGCAGLRPEPPQVSLVALQVQELTLSHINMRADLRLFNPNRFALNIQEVDYALSLNGIRVSSGKSLAPSRVAAGDSADISLRISGSYLSLLQLIGSLQRQEDLHYLLDGVVRVGGTGLRGYTFPLREEGMISAEILRGALGDPAR